MELGRQPLNEILDRHGWNNHDVVAHSSEGLTHKVVQKARKGRQLTRRAQEKILRALNAIAPGAVFHMEDVFNYRAR